MDAHVYRVDVPRDIVLNPVEALLYQLSEGCGLICIPLLVDRYLDFVYKYQQEYRKYTTDRRAVGNSVERLVEMGYLQKISGKAVSRFIGIS